MNLFLGKRPVDDGGVGCDRVVGWNRWVLTPADPKNRLGYLAPQLEDFADLQGRLSRRSRRAWCSSHVASRVWYLPTLSVRNTRQQFDVLLRTV